MWQPSCGGCILVDLTQSFRDELCSQGLHALLESTFMSVACGYISVIWSH